MSSQTTPRAGLDVAIGEGVEALAGCDLQVDGGSFIAIIGPNGSGKSTLLRLIAGLLAPTSGNVTVDGDMPRPGDGRVGLAFQQPRLVPWRSTLDNVALPANPDATVAHPVTDTGSR